MLRTSVDFKNTVLIRPRTLGRRIFASLRRILQDQRGGHARTDEGEVQEALKAHFRPEFLTVSTRSSSSTSCNSPSHEIVDFLVRRIREQLEAQGIGIELTREARSSSPRRVTTRPLVPAASACDPTAHRGPAVGEDPLERVQGR